MADSRGLPELISGRSADQRVFDVSGSRETSSYVLVLVRSLDSPLNGCLACERLLSARIWTGHGWRRTWFTKVRRSRPASTPHRSLNLATFDAHRQRQADTGIAPAS